MALEGMRRLCHGPRRTMEGYFVSARHDLGRVSVAIISMSAFIVVTPFIADAEGSEGLPTAAMSAQGLFVAIVLGLVNGWVYQWFIGHNIEIRIPDGVPPAVARSFSGIIPGAVIITTWLIVFSLLEALHWPDVHAIVQTVVGNPLGALGSNIGGVVVLVLLSSALWFNGNPRTLRKRWASSCTAGTRAGEPWSRCGWRERATSTASSPPFPKRSGRFSTPITSRKTYWPTRPLGRNWSYLCCWCTGRITS